MPNRILLLLTVAAIAAFSTSVRAQSFGGTFSNQGFSSSQARFISSTGTTVLRSPVRATFSDRVNGKMLVAARIAEVSAERHSTKLCWRYVKQALVKADAVSSYPSSVYAKQAARELTERFGFVRLNVRSPLQAPVGSVLVYGGRGAGHVEIRTTRGYVSDYRSRMPSSLPFLGAFAKAQLGKI